MNGATRTDRALPVISVLASAYFAFIALDNLFFRLEWVGVGVLRELLTIHMILAVGATCVVALARRLLNRSTINPCNAGAALIGSSKASSGDSDGLRHLKEWHHGALGTPQPWRDAVTAP